MNRYFWLLIRFIGDGTTLDDRRAVYDRARRALEAQLSGATPPPDLAHSDYERLAFEEAVRTVESCIARWGIVATAVEG